MHNDTLTFVIGMIIGAIVMLIVVATVITGSRGTYRDGQIDYAQGKILYVLKANALGENVWTRKE